MRKHHVPFGWPRRDPRHSRFPLPNAVWEYQLKPIAFVILSYLCCHSSHGGTRVLTPEVIAKGIHKTEDTVRKYLSDLEDAGLVSGQYSIAADFLSAESGKFFTLPTEIFLLNLPPAAFMVYAYLLLIEDRRTHTCHPSYNTIAATTGMSKKHCDKSHQCPLGKTPRHTGAQPIPRSKRHEMERQQPLHHPANTERGRRIPPAAALPLGARGPAKEAPQTAGAPSLSSHSLNFCQRNLRLMNRQDGFHPPHSPVQNGPPRVPRFWAPCSPPESWVEMLHLPAPKTRY